MTPKPPQANGNGTSQGAKHPGGAGARFAKKIAESGLSRSDFAAAADVRLSAVSDFMAGRNDKCGSENVKRIKQACYDLHLVQDPRRRPRKGYRHRMMIVETEAY